MLYDWLDTGPGCISRVPRVRVGGVPIRESGVDLGDYAAGAPPGNLF